MVLCASPSPLLSQVVEQSMRDLPVVHQVDVVVVGGSVGGVAAAVAAAEEGCSVLLAAPRPYLGEDMCATLRLWLDAHEEPAGPLTERIFAAGSPATPMLVKKTLDEALLQARVEFLLGCYVTDVLWGGDRRPAGVVMANRAGRQAVVARVIVDATARAQVARMAGARCRRWPRGDVELRRVVLSRAGAAQQTAARQIPCPTKKGDQVVSYFEYALQLTLPDGGFASMARAEQEARDVTYTEGQLRASERLFLVPPDPIVGRRRARRWKGLEQPHIGHFRPRGVQRVYVVSGAAGVPRADAEKLCRPSAQEAIGRFVGQAAAQEASSLPDPTGARAPGRRGRRVASGDVREVLSGLRPTDAGLNTVPSVNGRVPVLGEYEVVVVGGGTSGACAAIGAARQGARVLVAEYQEGLGGTGTLGLIGKPYHGKSIGFSREVPFPGDELGVEDKMEWFRRQIRDAGGHIWFGVLGCGAFVDGQRVKGAVVATPQGRGVVLADVVIDATGNADIAVAAGADSMYGGSGADIAMQGAGLPTRALGSHYVNTDYLLVDESDMTDVWRALVGARQTMSGGLYDVGPLIQTRERRRVIGEHVLAYLDQICGRTYPDSIVFSGSDYDSHGYPSQPFFALIPHDEKSRAANHPAPGGSCYTPYRCLLPRGLEGLLVTGLGISMERDASAMVRMQRDMHNQGYAAGVAAAMAAKSRVPPRDIDVDALQKHLVAIGNLPEEALAHDDSFPLPEADVREAVARLPKATNPRSAAKPLAIILSHRETALPILHDAYAQASEENKLTYARLLGFLGDKAGVPVLIAALDEITEWDDRILQGSMAEYAHLPTPIDTLILALGHTGDGRALPPILRKLETLHADVTLSHHRAVALALERLGDPAATEPLARLLARPGMRGHAMTELEPLHNSGMDRRRRLGPLREIALARALYRCGDRGGLGEQILREYTRDLRGLFARHARAVLGDGGEQ
jgi:hypothetical protein